MCGRFTLAASLKALQIRFDFDATELTYLPRYNIALTQPALTIIGGDSEEKNRAGFMR